LRKGVLGETIYESASGGEEKFSAREKKKDNAEALSTRRFAEKS
jgi:hypothetical protein